jgi:hypothetical protein
MAAAPRDPAVLLAALALVEKHKGNVRAAGKEANVPQATFQHRYEAAKQWDKMRANANIIEPLNSFDDAWKQWQKAIGMARDDFKPPKPRKATGRVRIVAAGDFHVPFHDRDAVAELIAREGPNTDILAIGGDFGDAQAASTFVKYESVPFKDEMAETTACMQALAEAFPSIHYLRGSNHMDRIEKRLRERLDPEIVEAVLYMTGGELSPDVALAKRYKNIKVDCWVTPSGKRVPWLMVIGDVAFSHAEKYSRVPGAALRSVEEWLNDFSGALGLPEIRAVVQFHTHAMALLPWRTDKVLIEPGCMCHMHGYQLGSRLGGRPQRIGYVAMELENGRVDFDSIKLRWLNREESAA